MHVHQSLSFACEHLVNFIMSGNVDSQPPQAEDTTGKGHLFPPAVSTNTAGLSAEEVTACNKEVEATVQQQGVCGEQ